MLANIENLFSRDSSRNHSHVPLGRFPLLQAYMVPIVIMIASLFSPHNNHRCSHIRPPPLIKSIASISGPALYRKSLIECSLSSMVHLEHLINRMKTTSQSCTNVGSVRYFLTFNVRCLNFRLFSNLRIYIGLAMPINELLTP